MGIGGKKLSEYWPVIKFPFYVLLAYYVLGFITAFIDLDIYFKIFSAWAALGLNIVVFGYAGWSAVEDHNFEIKNAAWSGAVLGMISSVVVAVISILAIYIVPGVLEAAVNRALAAGSEGVTADMLRTITVVMAYVNLILGPIINGLIGAGIAAIGGLIGKKL